jgi:acetyl-CoA carboxylase biotin carboxyl carrier protein
VTPGSVVAPGDVVALIETMKLFNEVTADVGGAVTSVVASDGDLVEAGQPLLYVSAEGGQP